MNFFKKDPNYLVKYFILNSLCFGTFNIIIYSRHFKHYKIHFNFIAAIFILLGLVAGLISATAFHNASHRNIKPRLLNDLIGEFTASFSLEDIRCFRIGHMLHHMHVDDQVLDPHPPKGLSFLQFIMKSRQKTISCISNLYYRQYGKSKKSRANVSAQILLFHVAVMLKLIFWFLTLGPFGFIFFFIPSYLSYFFGFAHLNYISHQDEEGEAQIHNHNEDFFYKVMNVLTSGGYYHKNHHLSPGLYNPSTLSFSKKDKFTNCN